LPSKDIAHAKFLADGAGVDRALFVSAGFGAALGWFFFGADSLLQLVTTRFKID
jgi:hypothetical protein